MLSKDKHLVVNAKDTGLDKLSIHIGYVKNRTNFMKAHQHDGFVEFCYIVKGELTHYINGDVINIKGPSLIFVNDGDIHHLESSSGVTMYLVMVHCDAYKEMWDYLQKDMDSELNQDKRTVSDIRLTSSQVQLLNSGFNNYFGAEECGKGLEGMSSKSLLTQLAVLHQIGGVNNLDGRSSIKRMEDAPEWFIALCHKTTEDQLFINGGVEGLVIESGKSNAYLGKCFRQYRDETPSAFINNLRLNYAKDLLLYSDTPVIEVCMESGFGNLSHFYHLFKNYYHTSPSKFRLLNRKDYMI